MKWIKIIPAPYIQFFALASLFFCSSFSFAQMQIEVHAGDFDRNKTPITFTTNPNFNGNLHLLNPDTEENIPLQQLDDTTYLFVLDTFLPKGESRVYKLNTGTTTQQAPITLQETTDAIIALANEKPVFSYNTATLLPKGEADYYKRSGFLHPVYSPSGKTLTDGFPKGHTHQHGIFMAWVNTQFQDEKVDFWNQHDQTGTIRHQAVKTLKSGPWAGSFTTTLEHLALQNDKTTIVLEEEWTVTIYPFAEHFVFDIQTVQENVSQDTLYISDYHYGGMAFRGSAEWNAVDTTRYTKPMQVLTSEGVTDVETANHKRPNWLDAYGKIDGSTAGIAIFGHPSNYKHPQPIRVHPTMPYFCFAPMVTGGFAIAPGEMYTSNYRFVTHDGEPDTNLLEQLWHDYATPPQVQLLND